MKVVTSQIRREISVVTMGIRQNQISSKYIHCESFLCEYTHIVSLKFKIVFLAYKDQ